MGQFKDTFRHPLKTYHSSLPARFVKSLFRVNERFLRWMHRQTSRSIWGIVAVLLGLALLDGLVFGISMSNLISREYWVRHSLSVQNRLDDLSIRLNMAETGQRGYLLTNNDSYLQSFTQASPHIQQDLQDLQQLTQDNTRQRQLLASMRPLIADKIDEMQQTIDLQRAGNRAAASQIVASNQGQILMQQIEQDIQAMQGEENRLLTRRDQAAQGALAGAVISSVLGLLVVCGAIVLAGRLIQIYLAQRERQALERQTQLEAEQGLRRTAQEALSQRDQLFAIASHELKNPIAALLAAEQTLQRFLKRETLQNPRVPSLMQAQITQTRRLVELIDGMLDSSLIVNGAFLLVQSPLDFVQLVRQVVDEVQDTLNGQTLTVDLPDEPIWVSGDAVRLAQVGGNLLQNAIRYSSAGTTIRVRVEADASTVRLTVSDQGIGMPADALPHIFNLLYRAPNVQERSVKGMGVGLYVTQQIVQLHQGTIAVESEEGKGSEFHVTLPRLASGPDTPASNENGAAQRKSSQIAS